MERIALGTVSFNQRPVRVFLLVRKNKEFEDVSYLKCVNQLVDLSFDTHSLSLSFTQNMQEQNQAIIALLTKINSLYPLY